MVIASLISWLTPLIRQIRPNVSSRGRGCWNGASRQRHNLVTIWATRQISWKKRAATPARS